jgi:hypothetical protein
MVPPTLRLLLIGNAQINLRLLFLAGNLLKNLRMKMFREKFSAEVFVNPISAVLAGFKPGSRVHKVDGLATAPFSFVNLGLLNDESRPSLEFFFTNCENEQGCQMVYFQTKNTNLGKFWTALEWKRLVCSMAIGIVLWPFGIHLVI